jgi:tetratricopeptide (TPR) repeat protein
MLDRNSSAIANRVIKEYGSVTKKNTEKVTDELEIEVSIKLIDSCTTFFRFTDSLKHQQYKNLNKDSLVRLLNGLGSFDTTKSSKIFFVRAGVLYYQLGDHERALKNAERVLSEDSVNITALFIKAFIYDTRGNYQEAITLYDKVAELSHQKSVYIYSALARRKKNGL